MSSGEEDKVFSRGAVVRVTLRNFLTYDDVTVRPGPRLNLLIGPNGSGKSTIVAALVLGLAGSPQMLGRASKIALFIKEGADPKEGFIEIELFDPAGNHVISRTIQEKVSKWTYNGEEVAEDRIKTVVTDLNIQVDNLCQILPQERVQDFVKMDAQALLEGTEKAVGYRGMHEDHLFLKDSDKTEMELNRKVAERRKTLDHVESTIQTLQVDVDNQQKREKYEKMATKLKQRREWLRYELAQAELVELCRLKEEAKRGLNTAEEALEPLKKRLVVSKKEEKSFEMKLDTTSKELREKRKAVDAQRARAKHAEDEVGRLSHEQRQRETREAARQEREDGLRQKLEAVTRDLDNAEDPGQALEGEIRACDAQIRELSSRISRCQGQLDAGDLEQRELAGRENGFKNELNRVQSVADRRLELLQQRNRDVHSAVLWLRQNRNRFQYPVHEPMILLMNVQDSHFAKYVQGAVPWSDLLAFTCESRADMNIFLQELRERQRLRISCVLSDPAVPLDSLRPQRSRDQLVALGFQCTVGDLFSAPEAVRRYLYKTHRLQNIPVADVADEAADRVLRAAQGQRGLNSFMIGGFRYRSGQSQYGSRQSWTSSEPLSRPDALLTLTTDTARERELRGLIDEAVQSLQALNEASDAARATVNELNNQLEQARRAKKDLTARRDIRRVLVGRRNTTQKALQECEKEKCDLPAEACKTAKLIETQLNRLAATQGELLESCKACQTLELRSEVVRAQLDLAKRRTKELERELGKANEGLTELKRKVSEATNGADVQKHKSMQLRRAALGRLGFPENPELPKRLQRFFAGMPNTIEEVEANLRETEARAEMLTTDDDAVRRYYGLKEQQVELTEELEHLETKLQRLRNGAKDRRDRWLADLEKIVTEVNKHFGQFFSKMDCSGEVALSRPESERAADYGVAIRVKFREAEQLCELSGTHHSGGERSVATMLYVMALQHLRRTSVPFHCVDEINQGMDARNERRVFELVVRAAVRSGGAQYFLVTPKLLPNLQYPPHGLTVLCVFSPVMGRRFDWDMAAFIRRKRRAAEAQASAAAR